MARPTRILERLTRPGSARWIRAGGRGWRASAGRRTLGAEAGRNEELEQDGRGAGDGRPGSGLQGGRRRFDAGGGGSPGSGGPPAGEVTCGADCAADLTVARAALEASDYAGAFAQYRCADSREAAFGAGLTRMLTLLEEPAATQLMAHLGLAPLVATDLLGPDSIVSRLNRRWDGEGTLAVSGALTATLPFDRAQLEVGEWPCLEAVNWTSHAEADLYVEFTEPAALTAGSSFSITFDCAATSPSRQVVSGLSYLEWRWGPIGHSNDKRALEQRRSPGGLLARPLGGGCLAARTA
ncbi:MAG: hypothetical protein JW751_24390 [Polyangiaceae bacterium]|nr:hypothetical protein [Polyangiaceae bacterium]